MADPDGLTRYETTYATGLARAAGMRMELQELVRCRGLAMHSIYLADGLSTWGRPDLAGALYGQALAICELRAEEVGTPSARRDLSVALARLGGLCPLDVLGALVPQQALEALGIRRVPSDEVVLRPWLMRHAVEQ
jgi:hypothetical protein